ncbi:proline dehydrogenase [Rhizina undulata]
MASTRILFRSAFVRSNLYSGNLRAVVATGYKFHSTSTTSTATTSHNEITPPGRSSFPEYPLTQLPTTALLRSLLLHSITSRPWLMGLGTKILLRSADGIEDPLMSPLKWIVDKTFYAQFCAGSTPKEISRTVSSLHSLGYKGIILTYAREVETTDKPSSSSASKQIAEWLDGTLKTIEYSKHGEYIAIKFTGAGEAVFPLLLRGRSLKEAGELEDALVKICDRAKEKGVRIMIDAEQAAIQGGVHEWTLELMRRYNSTSKAMIYNTYQMYLRSSSAILNQHLTLTHRENFVLGVKIVRGAYIHSDPRELIHPTKAATDAAYDSAIHYLLTESPAKVDLIVASHNKQSIETALKLRRSLHKTKVGEMVYAQLMGMADELSLGLLGAKGAGKAPDVYKYVVWGSTKECVKYLVRRAEENKDAAGRSQDNREAVAKELWRRIRQRCGGAGVFFARS